MGDEVKRNNFNFRIVDSIFDIRRENVCRSLAFAVFCMMVTLLRYYYILFTSKTPYLAIKERVLGKKRLFVSVHYAVKYCIYIKCETPLLGAGLSQGTVLPTVGKPGPEDFILDRL